MDPTIIILQPLAGATVPQNFQASGTVSPPDSTVIVTLWNSNSNSSVIANVPGDGTWSADYQDIPTSTYNLKACVDSTCDQHDNITVQ